ncbi:hypothetical protein GALL_95490 [mine drainage metagenome]|uniref:Uncharacterized protein n=1 Tax=mine drainage metagenome TaxID=410659 RepID=A0A1J5SWI1_9ZZZZ
MKKMFFSFLMISFFVAANAQNTTLQQFTGKYKFPDGSVVTEIEVTLDSSGVLTSNSTAGTSVLEKISADTFSVVSFQGTAVFKRDANHKVTGVVVDAMGYHLEGTKDNASTSFLFTKPDALKIKTNQFAVR